MEPDNTNPGQAALRSVFIGREVEKGLFAGAIEQVSQGKGCLLLLSGEPGIGKSRLADELASDAARRGFVVASGRCWEAGGAPAYWPVVQALRSCLSQFPAEVLEDAAGPRAGEIVQILPELGQVVGETSEAPTLDSEAARFSLFDATTSFLTRLSRSQPIFLVFDDLHVADTPSLLFLRFLADGMDTARILVLASYRDPDPDRDKPLDPALPELSRCSVTRPLKLGGLSRSDVSRFVEVNAGEAAPDALISLLYDETDGNPLFLGEVVRLLASEGRISESPPSAAFRLTVPESVRVAISRRLSRLTPRTQDLLSSAAVLGREFSLDVLERLLGVQRSDLLPGLDEATEFRIVTPLAESPGSLRFSHALIRDVLYDSLPPSHRLKLHLQAGAALEECYAADPEPHLAELAHHFVAAAPAGEQARAVDFSRRAAERASALLAHEEAARLYQLALSVLDSGADVTEKERCDLLLALGDAQARSGEYWAAKATFSGAADLAERAGTPEQLARAAIGYGGRYVWGRASGDTKMVTLLESALLTLGPEPTALRARVMARLAGALRDYPERDGLELAREAVEIARQCDKLTLAFCLGSYHSSQWGPDAVQRRVEIADELIALAKEIGDKEREFEGRGYRTFAALEIADIETARREQAVWQRVGDELKQPSQQWWMLTLQAGWALFEGDLARANELSMRSREVGERAQAREGEAAFVLEHSEICRQQARPRDAEELLAKAAREFAWYPMFRCVLARHYYETDRVGESRAMFEDLVSTDAVNLPFDNEWLYGASVLAEVCFLVSDQRRAPILYDALLPYREHLAVAPGELIAGSVAHPLGLLASTMEKWDQAEEHFKLALDVNQRIQARLWHTEAACDYARLLLSQGGPGRAEEAAAVASDALDTARELGLSALERKLSEVLSALPSSRQERVVVEDVYLFRREGEYWSIGCDGRSLRLKDSKGLQYIARLLAAPGKEIHVLELLADGGSGPAPTSSRERSDDGVTFRQAGSAELLDSQAREAYRSRLDELRSEISEAEEWNDPERASRARGEMDFIMQELSNALGLGGRSRRETSDAERARQSATKAIKQAIARIAKHDRELGDVLDRSIQTGLFCRYEPALADGRTWQIQ